MNGLSKFNKIRKIFNQYKNAKFNNPKELDLRHCTEKEKLLFGKGFKDGYLSCLKHFKDIINE